MSYHPTAHRNADGSFTTRTPAEWAAYYAERDAEQLAADPVCGGCGNDKVVVESGVIACPVCAAESFANALGGTAV